MAKKKDTLNKSKSFYSLKSIHAKTKKGTIYENDYVTIVNNDDIYNENIPLFSDSIFKFKIGTSESNKKRHARSNWVSNDEGIIWTKENIREGNISDESKIVLKPNYNSLADFAYYGSAVELIKATINDIILRFPGGLYYYEDIFAPEINIEGETYYLISNECQIDCWSSDVNAINDNENPLRYLSYSYENYNIAEPKITIESNCLDSIIGNVIIDGTIFYIYKDDKGQNHLVTKINKSGEKIIEPKEEIIQNFWDSLDDFEKILLNKDSKPQKYTAIFDTPYETETGFYYSPKTYTWPTVGSSDTPDLSTSKFKGYINSLLSLAEFHDGYDSDNIWRMMTHEAIKNLDWTFNREDLEMDDIDNGRMKALIHIQGRLYDDIKRSIDNIKYTNVLSYNQKNNVPDYFLSDIAENNGWEAKNVNQLTTDKDVNSEFLRRLSLSSNYIQSMKGTRKGIEAILGMFGYTAGTDYTITEYIAKTGKKYKDFPLYDKLVCLRTEFDYVNADENTNFMQGYPVALMDDGKLIPWYDYEEKYVGNFYFQSKGGWKKMNSFITSAGTYQEYEKTYGETEPYMLYINDLNALTELPNDRLKNNMICYVADLGETTGHTHYFKLKNKSLSTILESGWTSASTVEVAYMESLVQNYKGNNPHIGKGEYDLGQDYLNKYENLYREAIAEEKITQAQADEANAGFGKVSKIQDNNKISIIDMNLLSSENGGDSINSDYSYNESYEVINVKNMVITFTSPANYKDEFEKYIRTTVTPYLEMMIPSTTIFEVLFE